MIKVLSLFSGIGAFEKALKNIGQPFELVGFSEIDKHAIKSYCAIHDVPELMNLGDITQINEKLLPKDIDLITYGFPCQDISLLGKQKGLIDENGITTRSGLFFDAMRIIRETQPKFLIAENVKNLANKRCEKQFKVILTELEMAGYNNYYAVLNSKDYGIPQNRLRLFIVSIRKDIDNETFEFPIGFPLELKLQDLLEDNIDNYLSEKAKKYILNPKRGGCTDINPDIIQPLTATGQMNWTGSFVSEEIKYIEKKSRVIGCTQPVIIHLRNGEIITSDDDLSDIKIRRLTTKECFRLMGYTDEDFAKAKTVNSDNQLYKQTGNSVVVNVLSCIFQILLNQSTIKNLIEREL